VNLHKEAKGIKIATGTIVDATIRHVPSSTNNEKNASTKAQNMTCKRTKFKDDVDELHRKESISK